MPPRVEFGGASPPLPDLYSSSTLSISTEPGERIERNHNHRVVIGLAVGGSVIAAIAFIIVLLLLLRRLKGSRTRNASPLEKEAASVHLRKFSYRDLKAATKSFDDVQKLGQGGFGVVYRGQLGHNGQEIAVKVLDSTSLQGEREFHNEVSVIGKVSASPHIVGLLGYCCDTKRGHRLLVYEYMQNRSLQDALFDNTYPVQLSWGARFKIMMDTAKALAFLHTDCDPPIIHGVIKPSNILLDARLIKTTLGKARLVLFVSREIHALAVCRWFFTLNNLHHTHSVILLQINHLRRRSLIRILRNSVRLVLQTLR